MKKILLAEDEEILRMLIVDTLEDENFSIDEAEDGKEAISYIEKNQYDLIILDYMMPIYTGLEVIEKTRFTGINKYTKILMLSAKNQQFDQDRVLGAGAEYFMSKPFSPSELLEKVEAILNGD